MKAPRHIRNSLHALKDAQYPRFRRGGRPQVMCRAAMKQCRDSQLSSPWRAFVSLNPSVRAHIKAL